MDISVPEVVAISDATNASPIVITAALHGYSTGDTVQVTGVGGNQAANGIWIITVVDPSTFSLDNSEGDGDYTTGGQATLVAGGVSIDPDSPTMNMSEVTTTEGTGDIALLGASDGIPFGSLGDGATVHYKISDASGTQFETGIGTYNAADNTISRDEVTSSSEGEASTDPINFAAGEKMISAVSDAEPVSTEIGQPTTRSPVQWTAGSVPTDGGVPEPLNEGMFSMQNRLIVRSDEERCGPAAATVAYRSKLIHNLLDPHIVRLLQTTQNEATDTPIAANQLIRRYVDVNIFDLIYPDRGGDFSRLILDVSIPSVIPFNTDNDKIPSQARALAFRPADVFMYMPHRIPGRAQAYPQLFYLNWYSSLARNNANEGAPNGHALSTANGWRYLDVTGPFSAFNIGTAAYDKVEHRYLYVGTIGGLRDATVVCERNKRMTWNVTNKIMANYHVTDPTARWSPPGARLTTARNSFSRMNAAAWGSPTNVFDSPWHVYQIVGLAGSDWLSVSASVQARGNLRAKIGGYDHTNAGINLREMRIDQAVGEAITPDIANDADVTVRTLQLPGRRIPTFTNDVANIGVRIYRVMEAMGTANGVMTDTPFFSNGSCSLSGEH